MPHRAHVLRRRPHRRHARDDPRRRRGRPQGRPGEARAVPEGGLRRHLRGDGRPARHHPPARPAAARVPAARRRRARRRSPSSSASPVEKVKRARRRSCTSSTRCWASAAAGCRSSSPRSATCRSGRSSRRPSRCKKKGKKVLPEIMIPLVGIVEELILLKKRAIAVAEECMKKAGVKVEYQIGTMIELPRAALTADKIAEEAEFFSLRHQRPDPDDVRLQPRRHQGLHADLPEGEDPAGRPVPDDRRQRRRPADRDGHQEGPRQPQGEARPAPEGRHLRRARRRPGQRRLLPQGRAWTT